MARPRPDGADRAVLAALARLLPTGLRGLPRTPSNCRIVTPFLASTFGWLFTEMGRQPWIVYGLMKTGAGISPGVSTADVAVTLGGLVPLYTVLGVIDVVLMFRAARGGLGDAGEPRPPGQPSEPTATELVY